jgi:hypothetical protein
MGRQAIQLLTLAKAITREIHWTAHMIFAKIEVRIQLIRFQEAIYLV